MKVYFHRTAGSL